MTLKKCSISIYSLKGVSPPPLWLPGCDNPRTCATSAALSAGAVGGDRHGPLLGRVGILNFISMEKEVYRAEFIESPVLPQDLPDDTVQ
jgi:hypothetical protein